MNCAAPWQIPLLTFEHTPNSTILANAAGDAHARRIAGKVDSEDCVELVDASTDAYSCSVAVPLRCTTEILLSLASHTHHSPNTNDSHGTTSSLSSSSMVVKVSGELIERRRCHECRVRFVMGSGWQNSRHEMRRGNTTSLNVIEYCLAWINNQTHGLTAAAA